MEVVRGKKCTKIFSLLLLDWGSKDKKKERRTEHSLPVLIVFFSYPCLHAKRFLQSWFSTCHLFLMWHTALLLTVSSLSSYSSSCLTLPLFLILFFEATIMWRPKKNLILDVAQEFPADNALFMIGIRAVLINFRDLRKMCWKSICQSLLAPSRNGFAWDISYWFC